jgi:hypothetical protein
VQGCAKAKAFNASAIMATKSILYVLYNFILGVIRLNTIIQNVILLRIL